MERRDFIKSGIGVLASTQTLGPRILSQSLPWQEYERDRKLVLSNKYMDWNLVMTGESIRSEGLRNKLAGQAYQLSDSKEFEVTLSQSKSRIEIPWWYFHLGIDNDDASPDNEAGLLAGYHREDFHGEEQWDSVLNLLLRTGDRSIAKPVFKLLHCAHEILTNRFYPFQIGPAVTAGKPEPVRSGKIAASGILDLFLACFAGPAAL